MFNEFEHFSSDDPFVRNITNKGDMMSIIFRTTSACNLRCSYCYQHKNTPTFITEKHLDKMKVKIQEIYDKRAKSQNKNHYTKLIFIGGEVSLNNINKKILEMMYTIKTDEVMWLEICTNAYEISDSFLDFLNFARKDNHFISINVSLDINKKIHDFNRKNIAGEGSYDKVIENIKKLKSLGFKVKTNAVISKEIMNTYDPEIVFENLKNIPADNKNISYDYSFALEKSFNQKETEFITKILDLQINYAKECLNNCKLLDTKVFEASLECVSYTPLYINRLFCDIRMVYTFEAIDDENFIIAKCHGYTWSNKNNRDDVFLIYNSKNPSQKNMLKIMEANMDNYECNTCEFAPFCRQICLRYNRTTECVKINKQMAIRVKNAMKEIVKTDDFYNKIIEYFKKFGEKLEYESWIKNKDLWKERIFKLYGVKI